MTTRSIVAVSAGLSTPSSTRMLADRLAEATTTSLGERGESVAVRHVELRDVAHGITDMMLTGFAPTGLRDVLDAVTGADGLILVTPLFTTTYSGLFKSFVDVLDKDSLVDMPVLLGATGGTPRHSLALEYSMRPLLTYLRADVATTSVFAATDDWARAVDDVNPLPRRIDRAGRELATLIAGGEKRRAAAPADPFASPVEFADLLAGIGGTP